MALEIRELIVKVTVDEANHVAGGLTPKERKSIVEDCKKAVVNELARKRKR